jgi:hypothetical protein
MKMNELSIVIPVSAYKAFDPIVQRSIMAYVMDQLGAAAAKPLDPPVAEGRNEKGLAKLDVPESKQFLNNCSEKTTTILQEIVDRDGDFMASVIANHVGTSIAELRGAWAGLTKRVRTITKDSNALLLNWFKEGDDWHGVMAAQTVASMRIALSERG